MSYAKSAQLVSVSTEKILVALGAREASAHLRAASRLVMAALDEVRQLRPAGTTAEVARRDLEIEVRSLVHLVGELAERVIDLRSPLPRGACPHCGAVLFGSTSYGNCLRCGRVREVPRERRAVVAASDSSAAGVGRFEHLPRLSDRSPGRELREVLGG